MLNYNSMLLDNEKDKTRWERIFEILESYDDKSLKKAEKILTKNISSKEKKKLLVFLLALSLESDFVKWEAVKSRISSFIKICNEKKSNKTKTEETEEDQKTIDDLEYIELYINIGKDKRVFPRDLINFIRGSMKIAQKDIKNIKIHDKFSFFHIPKEMSDKAIILLSVKKFRGKNIVVNYSKHEKSE